MPCNSAKPKPAFWRSLTAYSDAIDYFYYRLNLTTHNEEYWTDVYQRAYGGAAWSKRRDAFGQFLQVVQSHGGRLAVVTFPTLAGVDGLQEILDRIDAHWEELGVPHLSLLPVLEPYDSRSLVVNPGAESLGH